MSSFTKAAVLAAVGLLVAAQTSEAQHHHHGGGTGVIIGAPGFGGWGGGWGGGYGGYGPGFFGPRGAWGGYGGYPSFYSSTNVSQSTTVMVSLNVTQQSFYGPQGGMTLPPDKPASIEVKVPENAVLWFDGKKTAQTGAVRQFVTPPLTAGAVNSYEIRAIWTDSSGAEVIRTQSVTVVPDQRAVVNFVD
jgi:uncharacterized protein (TIGR03000 family)